MHFHGIPTTLLWQNGRRGRASYARFTLFLRKRTPDAFSLFPASRAAIIAMPWIRSVTFKHFQVSLAITNSSFVGMTIILTVLSGVEIKVSAPRFLLASTSSAAKVVKVFADIGAGVGAVSPIPAVKAMASTRS
jgi:hypothetical protein